MAESYSRMLVMGRLMEEDITWVEEELFDINRTVYVVDDESPENKNRVPANKGHEAMVYLTYIIDHYDELADATLFFHPHKYTWHNNILLDLDQSKTIRRLNPAHVVRKGYMPARCHHDPGCPDWLHVDRPEAEWDLIKKGEEQHFTSKVWRELHPFAPIPPSISAPCCAQFAVSRERIHAQPRSEYIRYRDWLLWTSLTDNVSGRIMEYTWQYIFTGEADFCPSQAECYCDGYGVCFGGPGEKGLDHWLDTLKEREHWDKVAANLTDEGNGSEAMNARAEANRINNELNRMTEEANDRGKDPKNRAVDCGRPWHDGDGF